MSVEYSGALRRAILLAIDAGQQAAAATRQIATANSDPEDSGTVIRRWWASSKQLVVPGPAPDRHQVERARHVLDDFAAASEVVNQFIEDQRNMLPSHRAWSDRLSTDTAAEIHNEVNNTLATINRHRVNLIMNRPLQDGAPE